jgi:hypothetical protein
MYASRDRHQCHDDGLVSFHRPAVTGPIGAQLSTPNRWDPTRNHLEGMTIPGQSVKLALVVVDPSVATSGTELDHAAVVLVGHEFHGRMLGPDGTVRPWACQAACRCHALACSLSSAPPIAPLPHPSGLRPRPPSPGTLAPPLSELLAGPGCQSRSFPPGGDNA